MPLSITYEQMIGGLEKRNGEIREEIEGHESAIETLRSEQDALVAAIAAIRKLIPFQKSVDVPAVEVWDTSIAVSPRQAIVRILRKAGRALSTEDILAACPDGLNRQSIVSALCRGVGKYLERPSRSTYKLIETSKALI